MRSPTNNSVVKDTIAATNNNVVSSRIQDLCGKEGTPIREIDSCLTSCSKCTGIYTDSIDGTRIRIICRHECHSLSRRLNTEHNGLTGQDNWTGFEE
jgi:hypothetical protein